MQKISKFQNHFGFSSLIGRNLICPFKYHPGRTNAQTGCQLKIKNSNLWQELFFTKSKLLVCGKSFDWELQHEYYCCKVHASQIS
jgi:hypothetical protein